MPAAIANLSAPLLFARTSTMAGSTTSTTGARCELIGAISTSEYTARVLTETSRRTLAQRAAGYSWRRPPSQFAIDVDWRFERPRSVIGAEGGVASVLADFGPPCGSRARMRYSFSVPITDLVHRLVRRRVQTLR